MTPSLLTLGTSVRCFLLDWAYMRISNALGCTLPDRPHFSLDALGMAGVIGGDEAASAIATIHIYGNRRWLGWYNSPGSYQIAKRFRLLSQSKFFDSFFPGVHTDPTTLFEPDAIKGPRFRAAHSGTILGETSRSAALFMRECAAQEGKVVEGRKSQAVSVTIAELGHVPEPWMYPKRTNAYTPALASIPIFVSAATCLVCGLFGDWHSFSLVLLGILTNGISSLVVGSAKLVFTHPDTPGGCPAGDGVLSSDNEIVLLKGAEGAVNSITRGRFFLSFPNQHLYGITGWCSIFFTIQFTVQLLASQCSLFGQTMFCISLTVSWLYNSWLALLDKRKIQRDILLDNVLNKPVLTKYTFGTRTAAVVFVLLVLQPKKPTGILEELLPNDTEVWRRWKETIMQRLLNREPFEFVDKDWVLDGLMQTERSLLRAFFVDAQTAYGCYLQHAVPIAK